ncbi:hypothetical protein F5146DRAFT_1143510 [Armillaria mellea]|nr:hypothetical protein F5146DRAFT_1143510 [Armillaria mellea]
MPSFGTQPTSKRALMHRQCFGTSFWNRHAAKDDVLKDQFFQWIGEHTNRRRRYAYKPSYANEVSSSLDTEIWALGRMNYMSSPEWEELTPEEREMAELQAYADEWGRQAALADFEDIPGVDATDIFRSFVLYHSHVLHCKSHKSWTTHFVPILDAAHSSSYSFAGCVT